MHPQTPSQNNESIITRFLRGYWRRTDERLQNPKTLLESMRRCFCSNYAEPSGGVTQICPQAVIVNLSRTLCDMRRDTLKLRVVPLIKLLSSCRKKSLFLQYSARVEQSWKRKGALLLLCISSFCQLCHSHLHRFWFVMWFSYISSVTHLLSKSVRFILWGAWRLLQIFKAIHHITWDISGWIEVVDRLTEQRSHAWLKESWSPDDEPYSSSGECSTMRFTFVVWNVGSAGSDDPLSFPLATSRRHIGAKLCIHGSQMINPTDRWVWIFTRFTFIVLSEVSQQRLNRLLWTVVLHVLVPRGWIKLTYVKLCQQVQPWCSHLLF